MTYSHVHDGPSFDITARFGTVPDIRRCFCCPALTQFPLHATFRGYSGGGGIQAVGVGDLCRNEVLPFSGGVVPFQVASLSVGVISVSLSLV